MYGIELMIIIIATCGSALAGNGYAISVQAVIITWRFILGIGVGGDYPLSAVITSEFATTKRRGAMMGAVFAMQGFGILSSAIISIIVLAAFKSSIDGNVQNVDYCWRIVLGLGAVPGLVALYFRLTIPETPRYTMDIERNIEQAAQDITNVLATGTYEERNADEPVVRVEAPEHGWEDFKNYFGKWENGKVLLGTSSTWFMLDVAFYGIGLNNSIILNAIGYASSKDPFTTLWNVSVGNIIITLLGTIPGYWFSVAFVDSWGRKPIQLMGFALLTIIFIIWGFAYDTISKHNVGSIVIFTLAQFFQNFGPNATTFIVPGEVFPTRYRSTGHGISAASGKLGAILAQVLVFEVKDIGGKNAFVGNLIKIFAIFMFVGFLCTFLIPETKGQSLEELSKENQQGFVRSSKKREENH
ncbi:7757_t:CDS:2 [Ambispora leptoticha]|uniref:7757_t:CDS:1 n=1 Tax=Ambispora leptoticha TaxID=144679 RepID=A0A9N9ENI0_9GLOM|nr:7757_t:CDS:2 [Ambispora leptoticha]